MQGISLISVASKVSPFRPRTVIESPHEIARFRDLIGPVMLVYFCTIYVSISINVQGGAYLSGILP